MTLSTPPHLAHRRAGGFSGVRRFCREIVNFLLVINFRGTASPPKPVTLTKVRTSVERAAAI